MHLKFLARGTGSAAAAAAYLLAKRDAAGTERAAVEVLRGDPVEVARVADSLTFKYLYTSGVIAWSPEDAPTRAEIERVLDEFEETAWAGLDQDRYSWSAVLHRDHHGGVHVHVLAARCDLATGRSLNVASPGWQKTFDPLRDAFNYQHGWSRPDDPARARPYRPSPHLAYLDAETLRAGWEVEPDRRALIGEHLMGRVTDGAVKDRAGVVAALEGLGFEVPRQGRHYVTILRPETGERLRLKGGLYEADFDRERFIRQVREPSGDRERADRGDDAKRAADAWRELEEKRLKRAEYHRSRYGGGGRARAGGARDAAGAVEQERGAAAGAVEREAVPESLAGHLRRELGDEAVVAAGDSVAERRQELEAIRGAAAGDATACLAVLARVSVADDRDRAGADSGLARVVGAVRAGAEAAGRADRGLAGAGRVLAAAGRTARGCGDGLDRAVREPGPDLTELMRQRQEQRALVVAGREQAVCATSKGSEWLDDAQQEVLAGAARRPTVAERVRIVGTVEDRIGTYLAAREESLAATSPGSMLLRAEYGESGSASSPQQSFAKREVVIARVAQQVDEELEAREEMLRSMPLGRQYLSAAEQARAGGASGPPTPAEPAERESMVRAAEQRVRAELDRREERVLADTGDGRLLADAAEELTESGAIFGDGGLTERAQVIGRAEGLLEEERAALKLKEADLLEDAAGEELLRKARLDILGAADREAQTLADSWAVINQAAEQAREHQAALRTATVATQAAATRSNVELDDAHVRVIYETGETHAAGLAAVDRTTEALALAADQELPSETIVDTWKANQSDPGGIAAALDRAASGQRVSRLERLFSVPGAGEAFIAALDEQDPSWRTRTHPRTINRALDVAERDLGRETRAPWHALVLNAEQQFPGASSATWRTAGDDFTGAADTDRHGRSVSQALSDRARARALAGEGPSAEPEPARNLVQQVTDWLRTEVERQQLEALRARTGAARLAQRHRNSLRPVIEPSPPVPKPARLVPDATWEDAEPLWRALTNLQERTERGRLAQRARNSATAVPEKTPPALRRARLVPDATWEDAEPLWRALTNLQERTERGRLAQRARNSATAVPEKTPPAPRRARLVPDATREDAVAAAPLIVRARLPEVEQQELRLGVDIAAIELARDFGRFQWWSHAGGELEELHLREDRYLEFNDTKESPVEIGMLRTVLEKDVYEKAFLLVEHPAAEPGPPTNLVELVRAFIRRLQDAVDRLIDRVLDREPAHPSRPVSATDQVPAWPAPQPPVAPTEPSLRQSVPPAAAASPIVEPPAAPDGTHDKPTAESGRREASPPSATAPAPEPALNVTEAERVRVAVDAVKAKLPWTKPYSGNPSHRPPAVSDERFDHIAAATDDEFVKTVVTELQRKASYYTDSARSESEKTYLRPAITRKNEENRHAYKKANAARGFLRRRPPEPTWAEAESVVIKEFEAEQLVLIEGVCHDIKQRSPAAVRRELQRLEPKQVSTPDRSRSPSHTKQQDRGDTKRSR